jgi:hypothetical protein
MSKIRPFREEPNWLEKILPALVYIALGWIVVRQPVGQIGGILSLFMLLGILTWALVIRNRSMKYFIRYHATQAIILNMALAAVLWLLFTILDFFSVLPGVNFLTQYVTFALFSPMDIGSLGYVEASVKDIFIMAFALVLGFECIRGKYTEVPFITDGVRYWI